MLIRLKNICLEILFPAFCLSCRVEGVFLCKSCASTIPSLPPICIGCGILTPSQSPHPPGHTCKRCSKKSSIYAFFSPFPYRHPLVRRLIHEIKYRRITALAPILGDLLIASLSYYHIPIPPQAIIVPIPLHPRKERVRGFNQAFLLAEILSQKLSIPVDTQILMRNSSTIPQSSLSADQRHANICDVFEVPRTARSLRNTTIILVDDVKTSGATLEEAARMLKNAGAKKIWAITVAR